MFNEYETAELYLKKREKMGIKPGLKRIGFLLEKMGNPEKDITAIHVAGTNGKGSTIHYLKEAFSAHGYQVGVFTSPSINGLRGHILHDGQPIKEHFFIQIMNELYPHILQLDKEDNAPTTFEIITVIALHYFREHVEISLIETGMGGRMDTTNCITPILSVITNVALDHQQFLGKTISEIASHKAGIIKENIPVILGDLEDAAYYVVAEEARDKNARIYRYDVDFKWTNREQKGSLQFFQWSTQFLTLPIAIKGLGKHQIKNAATALMVLTIFHRTQDALNKTSIQEAFRNYQIPGRFEKVAENPIIILDGAHNPDGIAAFLQTVREQFPHIEKHLMFAGFQDKALVTMVKKCMPYFDTIYLTSFEHQRAINAQQLYDLVGEPMLKVNEDWKALLDMYRKSKNITEVPLFIVGSFHFISTVRQYILID